MAESTSETSYALYAAVSFACIGLLIIAAKLINKCRDSKNASRQSIEAFAYEETNVKQENHQDTENSSQQSYQNLAGVRPTTPAVF